MHFTEVFLILTSCRWSEGRVQCCPDPAVDAGSEPGAPDVPWTIRRSWIRHRLEKMFHHLIVNESNLLENYCLKSFQIAFSFVWLNDQNEYNPQV